MPVEDKLSPELRRELREGGGAGPLLGTGYVRALVRFRGDDDPFPLIRDVGEKQNVSGEVHYVSRVSGQASVVIPVDDVERLAADERVEKVWHVPKVTILPPISPIPHAGQGIPVPSALVAHRVKGNIRADGAGIKVGVVDSGVDQDHPALRGKVIAFKDFSGTGGADELGHGTHVAGIIVARPMEFQGVPIAGVAPGARLVVAKVFSSRDTTMDVVMGAVEWVTEQGAKIVNMSWGSSDAYPPLRDLVADIRTKRRVVFVAAAGNDPRSNTYPAAYPEVISVGSVAFENPRPNAVSAFTATGPGFGESQLPELSAYGGSENEEIVSTTPGGVGPMRGTSMSAPVVSGALAVLMGAPVGASGDEAEKALEQTAIDTGPPGVDPRTGYGVVNVEAAFRLVRGEEAGELVEMPVEPTPTVAEQGVATIALAGLVIVAWTLMRERFPRAA